MVKTDKSILEQLETPSFLEQVLRDYKAFREASEMERFRVYEDDYILSILRYIKDTPLVDLYPVTLSDGRHAALLGVNGSTERYPLNGDNHEAFEVNRLCSWVEAFAVRDEIFVWLYETLFFLLTKDLPVEFTDEDKENLLLTCHDWLLLTTHTPEEPNSPLLIDPTFDPEVIEEAGLLFTESLKHLYEKEN